MLGGHWNYDIRSLRGSGFYVRWNNDIMFGGMRVYVGYIYKLVELW